MLEGLGVPYELSPSARLKHDEASDNYHLFCIESGNHVRLNSTSHSILTFIKEGKNSDEIILSMNREYEIDLETCKKDVNDFLQFLLKNGLGTCVTRLLQ